MLVRCKLTDDVLRRTRRDCQNLELLSTFWQSFVKQNQIITTAYQSKGKYHKEPMGGLSKNELAVSEQGVIGFTFASDWLREWREFSGPITGWSKANQENLK